MSEVRTWFGELVRRFRTAAALSQEALAERAGLSRNAISDLERGLRHAPRLETVRLLADGLGLSEDDRAVLLAAARPALLRPDTSHPPAVSLPTPLTRLIGREPEIQHLSDTLRRQDVRLVTLTGVGGSGKTRLAIAVGERLADDFPDGVVFVDLTPLTDPDLVIATIAMTLGVREVAGQRLLHTLGQSLAAARMLLLLDNCERVLAAAPEVTALLAASPRLTVLATSREPLRVRGEREFPVPPLPLPATTQPPQLAQLGQIPAIALFVERAQASQPDFALTTENAAAVATICHRLDGLPLAIELAAARVKLLPPAALLARLEHRLPLLTGGGRDLPTRQRTMRDAIAWSYDLLDPLEQALFRQLSVFAGGATLEAVETIANPGQDLDVFAGLSALVDKSLVRQVARADEPRFSMLETVREFAAALGASDSNWATVEQRHTGHFLALAERAKGLIDGPDQVLWLARLAAELDNMRAVLERAIAHDDADIALRLGAALWRFWGQRGHLNEGRSALERALSLSGNADRAVRSAAIYYLGNLALDLREFAAASCHFTESLDLWRSLDDQDGIASSLNGLGLVAWYRGDYASADRHYNEALAIWTAIADWPGIAVAHHNLGRLAAAQGQYDLARSHHERALALRRQLGNTDGLAYSLWALGTVAVYQGEATTAEELFRESLANFRTVGDRQGEAYARHGLAQVSQHQGDNPETLRLFHEVLELRQSLGERNGIIEGIEGIAAVLARAGQVAQATRLLGAAAAAREAISLAPWLAERLEVDQALAIARDALSESAFASAWAAGQRMTLDQAMAEALSLSHTEAR